MDSLISMIEITEDVSRFYPYANWLILVGTKNMGRRHPNPPLWVYRNLFRISICLNRLRRVNYKRRTMKVMSGCQPNIHLGLTVVVGLAPLVLVVV